MDNGKLVSTVKDWMEIDNQIKECQKQTKLLREAKKELTKTLVDEMKNRELDCVDLKEKGKLLYTRNKVKSSLSKKHLLSSLATYFKDNDTIVKEITQHILDTREIKVKENIRRK